MAVSIRNKIEGTVKEIIRGQAVSEVDVDTEAGTLTSVITTRSVERMGLKVGDKVNVEIKSTDVFIENI
jgi:molybdopterin-binding protein